VIGHDGDDKLGGKDFDWALVEIIVRRLQQEYGDIPLCRSNQAARRAMAKLKYLAEEAKKMLSALQKVPIEIARLDSPFEEIDTVVELTRADLERATEHLTARCVSISKRLLKLSGLSSREPGERAGCGRPNANPLFSRGHPFRVWQSGVQT
jgi:molecular chaperone DnaK